MGTLTATDYKDPKRVLLHIGDCEYEVYNVKDKDSLEKILASTPCVVAQRGRLNAEGKYDQCYEPNTTGTTNTLTTALKDLHKQLLYLIETFRPADSRCVFFHQLALLFLVCHIYILHKAMSKTVL